MENTKIIKINKSTKILYSLFNFFAPISILYICVANFRELYNEKLLLPAFLLIFIGIYCLISNLKKYNQFLCINNKTITICKDKITNPKVIKIIDTEKIIQEILYNKLIYNLIIEYEYKKIRLLHTSFSVFGFICYIGPFITLLILKSSNNKAHKVNEIYQVLPELFKSAPRKPSKAEDIIIDFLTWCFVLFISYLGLFGILDTLLLAYNYLRN